jgi:hypothetical protein
MISEDHLYPDRTPSGPVKSAFFVILSLPVEYQVLVDITGGGPRNEVLRLVN